MSSVTLNHHQLIGEKIVEILNGATLSQEFRTYFEWEPVFKQEELRQLIVPVVPGDRSRIRGLARNGTASHLYGIDIAVIQKIEPTRRDERVKELMLLVDEIVACIQSERAIESGVLQNYVTEPLYDVNRLEQGLFYQATRFRFRVGY